MSHFIQVYGRIRPCANSQSRIAIKALDETRICCDGIGGKDDKIYQLHKVFNSDATQIDVYNSVAKNIVADCSEGVNGTIFAYGQTGSGKTHTMLGPNEKWTDPEYQGLIPRCVDQLFKHLMQKTESSTNFKYSVKAEFVEFYNEDIIDLIGEQSKTRRITLRDIGKDVQLIGSQSIEVENYVDLINVVKRGWEARKTAETEMNRDSSRSHAILIIRINTEELAGSFVTMRNSTLNLVDLAGSERQSHTKATGARLKEAAHINQSLTVLGRCIRELSKKESHPFIPYRESLLTHILKNSLGGNSRTAVIVNMHPDSRFLGETSSTLQFASACSMIKNQIVRNELLSGDKEEAYKETIKNLRKEMEQISQKCRSEYSERLSKSEKEKKELRDILSKQLEDYNELKTKYECHLIQSNNPMLSESALVDKILENRCGNECSMTENCDMGEVQLRYLQDKLELANLELHNMKEECNRLKQESTANVSLLNQYRHESFLLSTPGKNKRQSSRNLRRETIFILPEASESFEEDKENNKSVDDSDLKNMVEELVNQNKELTESCAGKEATIDKLIERFKIVEVENANGLKKFKRREEELLEEIEVYKQEQNEFSANKVRVEAQLNDLMADLTRKETELSEKKSVILEKEKLVEEKCREIDAMHEYHKSELDRMEMHLKEDTEEKIASLNGQWKKNIDVFVKEKEQEIARLLTIVNENKNKLMNMKSEVHMSHHEIKRLEVAREEMEERETRLKMEVDNLKETLQSRREAYNSDTESLKKKFREEKAELQRMLEEEKKQHSFTRKHAVDDYKKRSKKFDEILEASERKWEEEKKMAIKEREEEIRAEFMSERNRFERNFEQKLISLQAELESMKKIHENDTAKIIELTGGHRQNNIQYLVDLRKQISELMSENQVLRAKSHAEN